MKHISIFIIFFAFLGLKSTFAREVSSIKHADVSNMSHGEGLICPFQKSFTRKNEKLENNDLLKKDPATKHAAVEADTIGA